VARRILVIEDDPDVVHVVEAFLAREGFEVTTARDGVDGLEVALASDPDLIVLDWMLPRLDGPTLLRRLRAERSTPVIMLTARSEEEDRIAGLEVGADDYVAKPFSPRELVARVRAVLRRMDASVPEPSRMEHGGLVVDAQRRSVEVGGVSANLTAVEFDLLAALARAPGRVFRRDELLERVWGPDFFGVDRVVDVHVSKLRQKLAPLQAAEMIETVRGVGYRLT
jgi:DNA-binding response OmpR family regulator